MNTPEGNGASSEDEALSARRLVRFVASDVADMDVTSVPASESNARELCEKGVLAVVEVGDSGLVLALCGETMSVEVNGDGRCALN